MSSLNQIYHNSVGIDIYEEHKTFTFVCTQPIESQHSSFFEQASGIKQIVGNKVHWIFDKRNEIALELVSHIINTQVENLFSSPAVNLENAMKTLELSPQSNKAREYPCVVHVNKQFSIRIVDYSPAAMAMFCPQQYGTNNLRAILAAGGRFNHNLKANPEGTLKSPGWVFAKSNSAARRFLQGVAGGQDVVPPSDPSSTPEVVTRKTIGTISRGLHQRSEPEILPPPPPYVASSFTELPAVSIQESDDKQQGLPTLASERSSFVSNTMRSGAMLMSLLKTLDGPMLEVIEEHLDESEITHTTFFSGPISQVNDKIKAFEEQCVQFNAYCSKEVEIIRGNNKAVIVQRIVMSVS